MSNNDKCTIDGIDIEKLIKERHPFLINNVSGVQDGIYTFSQPIQNQKFVINGFDLKDTILEVLKSWGNEGGVNEELAAEITNTLAQKLGLIQGLK
jgi:hypothetical protein